LHFNAQEHALTLSLSLLCLIDAVSLNHKHRVRETR
jgi:hypothetical protein